MKTPGILIGLQPNAPADAPTTLSGETPWFPGTQLPVQIGVYKRLSPSGLVQYSLFDGGAWLWSHRDAARAAQVHPRDVSLVQHLPWCGLTAPPAQGYGPMHPAAPGGDA